MSARRKEPGKGRRFTPAVGRWLENLPSLRQEVRQELVRRQLHTHLPPLAEDRPQEVLDLGCGQGTQMILLARLGFEVVGVDLEEELLARARAALDGEAPAVRRRVHLRRGDLLSLPDALVGRFDVVLCHGVAMYLPLDETMTAVVGAARHGGHVSVLTRNRSGIAMRAGMSGDWRAALDGFDARRYRNRLGLDDVRADDPEEVAAALERAGASPLAWYGVRLFSDHFEAGYRPRDEEGLLLLAEEEAGRRDPYRRLAALTHTIAVRRDPSPVDGRVRASTEDRPGARRPPPEVPREPGRAPNSEKSAAS